MGERFKVATVDGYATDKGGRGSAPAGLSAHVLDTAYCHNVVATSRSEDFELVRNARGVVKGGKRLGHVGALAEAHALADELNAAES